MYKAVDGEKWTPSKRPKRSIDGVVKAHYPSIGGHGTSLKVTLKPLDPNWSIDDMSFHLQKDTCVDTLRLVRDWIHSISFTGRLFQVGWWTFG